MLDSCSELAKLMSLEFNVKKSHIGKMSNVEISAMNLSDNSVDWCKAILNIWVCRLYTKR